MKEARRSDDPRRPQGAGEPARPHDPHDAGHRARRRHGQRGLHADRHDARTRPTRCRPPPTTARTRWSPPTPRSRSTRRTTRSSGPASPRRSSPRSARSRRCRPPSGTSPTRRRSSATTASPSATARTSARASTRPLPGAAKLTAFRLQSGRWATGPGEVVIDAATSEKQHYAVGDRVRIDTRDEAGTFRVVGVTRFGNVKSLGTVTDRGVRPRDRAEAVPQAGPLRLDPRGGPGGHLGRGRPQGARRQARRQRQGADRGRP